MQFSMPLKLDRGEELLAYPNLAKPTNPNLAKPANPADEYEFDPFRPIVGGEVRSQQPHADEFAAFSTPSVGDSGTASGQKEKDRWENFE